MAGIATLTVDSGPPGARCPASFAAGYATIPGAGQLAAWLSGVWAQDGPPASLRNVQYREEVNAVRYHRRVLPRRSHPAGQADSHTNCQRACAHADRHALQQRAAASTLR
jgi:hypothetical protein